MKGSTQSYVQTKQQCITFMKEYAEKSLEELRHEDYESRRKGPQAGAQVGGGLFGSTQPAGVFGSTMQQPQSNTLFGAQQNPQQPTGLFGSAANTLGGGKTKLISSCCAVILLLVLIRFSIRAAEQQFWPAEHRRPIWEATDNTSHNIYRFHRFRSQHFDVRSC